MSYALMPCWFFSFQNNAKLKKDWLWFLWKEISDFIVSYIMMYWSEFLFRLLKMLRKIKGIKSDKTFCVLIFFLIFHTIIQRCHYYPQYLTFHTSRLCLARNIRIIINRKKTILVFIKIFFISFAHSKTHKKKKLYTKLCLNRKIWIITHRKRKKNNIYKSIFFFFFHT